MLCIDLRQEFVFSVTFVVKLMEFSIFLLPSKQCKNVDKKILHCLFFKVEIAGNKGSPNRQSLLPIQTVNVKVSLSTAWVCIVADICFVSLATLTCFPHIPAGETLIKLWCARQKTGNIRKCILVTSS